MVDDPELKPVIDFIISKNLPITGHMEEPRNCWLPLREMTVRSDSDLYVTCSISLPGTANGFAISALNIRTGSCMVRTFRIMGLIMVRR